MKSSSSPEMLPDRNICLHILESYLQYRSNNFGIDKNIGDVKDATAQLKLNAIENVIINLLKIQSIKDWTQFIVDLKALEDKEIASRRMIVTYIFKPIGLAEDLRLAQTLQALRSYINHSLQHHDEFLHEISELNQTTPFKDTNFHLLHYKAFIRSLGEKPGVSAGVSDSFITYLGDQFNDFAEKIKTNPMLNSYCEKLVPGCVRQVEKLPKTVTFADAVRAPATGRKANHVINLQRVPDTLFAPPPEVILSRKERRKRKRIHEATQSLQSPSFPGK